MIATYWSPVVQLRNIEETIACVLALFNNEQAAEATTVDMPPSYGMYGLYTTQKKFKEHFDIMIFIERYPLKRCQGCVKLIASKVNCFLNINDLSEVQLCMSSNSWT